MAVSFGYTIFLKDFMSSKLMRVSQTASSVYNKVNNFQDKFNNKLFRGQGSLDGLRNKLENLNRQKGTATTISQIRRINAEIARTERATRKLENLPPRSFRENLRGIATQLGGIGGLALGAAGGMAVFGAVKGLAKLGMDLEQTRIKYEVLLGSPDKANAMLESINKFANVTPFENADLQKNAELMLNFGINSKKILPNLKMLGDVSGGNKQKLDSLTLAYAQVSSAGKLTGQDLLQMINAGFNPLKIISDKTGVSMGKLKEQMSKGKISAKMVEDAFKSATEKGGLFHGMMEKVSQSGWGKISTIVGSLKSKLAEFSEQYLIPIVGKILDFGLNLTTYFDKVKISFFHFISIIQPVWDALSSLFMMVIGYSNATDAASSSTFSLSNILNGIFVVLEIVSTGLSTIINWLKPFSTVIKWVTIALGAWTVAQWALNIAMMANPVGLIIAAIVGLIGIIVYAYNKVGWFRGSIMAIWESIKGFGKAIKDLIINRIKELISGITGIGKALMHFFKGEWKEAWETGKKAAGDLVGVGTAKKAITRAKLIGVKSMVAYQKGVQEAEKNNKGSFLDKLNPAIKTPTATHQIGKDTEAISKTNASLKSSVSSDKVKKGINSINGGGRRQTNISISFDKLIENMTIKSETITESMDDLEDRVKEALMRVLNSANQMQTN